MKTVKQIVNENFSNKDDKELLEKYKELSIRFMELEDEIYKVNNKQFSALMYMWLDNRIHKMANRYRNS